MARASSSELLVLHGVRVGGFVTAGRVADRAGLPLAQVEELLLDHEAYGLLRHTSFGGSAGWSLTEAGRARDQVLLAQELHEAGAAEVVAAAYNDFERLNAAFLRAITDWQIRPFPAEPLAANDHTDWTWDRRVLDALSGLGYRLAPVAVRLSTALERFGGYVPRYRAAMGHVERGERAWVDAPERDSLHTIWLELHEDLLATLGRER